MSLVARCPKGAKLLALSGSEGLGGVRYATATCAERAAGEAGSCTPQPATSAETTSRSGTSKADTSGETNCGRASIGRPIAGVAADVRRLAIPNLLIGARAADRGASSAILQEIERRAARRGSRRTQNGKRLGRRCAVGMIRAAKFGGCS